MSNLSPTLLTIIGMAIVFIVLILLVILISIFGLFGRRTGKKDRAEKKTAKNGAGSVVQNADNGPKMVKTPVFMEIEEGIPGDVVAAIAAAVTYAGGGRNFAIRSIRRDRQSRSAWGMAGVVDNTRPF